MAETVMLAGRLRFYGWTQPTWDLLQEDGSAVDIKPAFWDAILAMAGQRGDVSYVARHFPSMRIYLDPHSDTEILAEKVDCGILASRLDGFGFSNIASYYEQMLISLNGRLVDFRTSADEISTAANRSEDVPHVLYFGEGNSARVPEGAEKTTCGIGQGKETCIFLTMGGDGFACAKFSGSLARHLMDRAAKGEMNAGRLGSCAVVGREAMPEDEEDKANG